MKRILCLLFFITLTGCDGGYGKIKKTVGIESPSPEDIQKQQEEAQKRLKDADVLVHNFTEKISQSEGSGGFKRHEGLTEIDPWGTALKVEYKQYDTDEVMTVRSAGPDSQFDTQDDLICTRSTSNFWGFHRGLSVIQWTLLVWVGSAIFGTLLYLFVGSQRVSHGKHRKHPFAGVFIIFLLGPIAFFILALSAILGMFGDGVDFDFGDI